MLLLYISPVIIKGNLNLTADWAVTRRQATAVAGRRKWRSPSGRLRSNNEPTA